MNNKDIKDNDEPDHERDGLIIPWERMDDDELWSAVRDGIRRGSIIFGNS